MIFLLFQNGNDDSDELQKKKTQEITDKVHYEKKLTKNIRPTDILQIYTSI